MGTPRAPERVKLIIGLMTGDAAILTESKRMLEEIFGRVDYEIPTLDLVHTEYYREEMGDGLKRKFLSFEELRDLETIYDVKLRTNELEKRFLNGALRRVNIDPGYLSLSKVVLFSTKDYSHRIYSGKGVFAEVTLYYKDKTYNPWPWTYPDYKTGAYIDIFNLIRQRYAAEAAASGR